MLGNSLRHERAGDGRVGENDKRVARSLQSASVCISVVPNMNTSFQRCRLRITSEFVAGCVQRIAVFSRKLPDTFSQLRTVCTFVLLKLFDFVLKVVVLDC